MKVDRAFGILADTFRRKAEFWFTVTDQATGQTSPPPCLPGYLHYWAPAVYGHSFSDDFRYRACHYCDWKYAFSSKVVSMQSERRTP